jgi:hypothetical protein
VSATVRVSTPSVTSGSLPRSGLNETRPLEAWSPTRPQQAAGMRSKPPPSPAVGHRDDTGGDRGGRPTRGPTRGQRGIPGVAGWSAQA